MFVEGSPIAEQDSPPGNPNTEHAIRTRSSTTHAPDRPYADFPAEFRGSLFRPGDPAFAGARAGFSGRWPEQNPALIVRPHDETDVAAALRYADDTATPVALRGGGHSVDHSAMPDDGFVIDMSKFKPGMVLLFRVEP